MLDEGLVRVARPFFSLETLRVWNMAKPDSVLLLK